MRLFALILVCALTSSAWASTSNWNGSADSNWANPSNWSSGVPGGSDTANITGPLTTFPVVSAGSVNVGALNLTGAELDVGSGFTLTVNTAATFSGSTTVGGLGTLALPAAGSVVSSGTLTSTGNISGTLQLNGTTLTLNGANTQTATLNLVIAANSNLNGGGTPAVAAGGTLTISPTAIGTQIDLLTNLQCDGTLTLNANATNQVGINIHGGITLTVNGTFNANASSTKVSYLNGSGAFVLGSTTATMNVATGSAEHQQSAAFTNNGHVVVNTGTLHFFSTVTSNGTLTATAAGTNMVLAPGQVLNSSGNISGALQLVGGTLQLTGDGAQTGTINAKIVSNSNISGGGGAAQGIATDGVLNVSPSATGNQLDLTADLLCSGTINLNADATNMVGINVHGGITLTIGGTLNANSSSGNVSFVAGSGLLSIAPSGFMNVTSGTTEYQQAAALTNSGVITVNTGALHFFAPVTNNNALTATAGTLLIVNSGQTVTSTGNISGTMQLIGCTLAFNGSGTQSGPLSLVIVGNSNLSGTGSPAIASGGVLNMAPTVSGAQLDMLTNFLCAGTMNLNANAANIVGINVHGGTTLTISGTLNANSFGADNTYIAGSGVLAIGSGGTMNIMGGTVEHSQSCVFSNAGGVNVASGNLHFANTVTNSGTLAATVAGTQMILGGGQTLTSTGLISGALQMAGSTLALNGNATQNDTLNLSIGANSNLMGSGSPAIAPTTGILNILPAGGNQLDLLSNFQCDGTINLNASATSNVGMNIHGGFTLTVNGTFNTNSTSANGTFIAGSGAMTISATGFMNSTAGAGAFEHAQSTVFTNSGTVTAISGNLHFSSTVTNNAVLTANAGAQLIQSTSSLTTTGVITGTLQLIGTTLALNGSGSQTGTLNISIVGNSNISGTAAAGIAAGGVVNISPTATGSQLDATNDLRCDGTINLNADATNTVGINVHGAVTLTINGILNANATSSNASYIDGSGLFTIGPAGKMNVAAGTVEHTQASACTNAGLVTVNSGALHFFAVVANSGTLKASAAGTQLILGPGQVLTSTGNIIGNLQLVGATLLLNGTGTQTGLLNLSIGANSNLGGSGAPAIAATGVVNIAPTAPGFQIDLITSLQCDGTINFNANAANIVGMNIHGGMTLTVNGILNTSVFGANNTFIAGSGLLAIGAAGAMNVAAGATEQSQSCAMTNAGNVTVNSGNLHFTTAVTNSGTITATAAGSQMILGSGQTLTTTGNLAGSLQIVGATLALNGNGTQTGVLNVTIAANSNFSGAGIGTPVIAANGALNITPAAGSQLDLTNDLRCDGTLSLNATVASAVGINVHGGVTLTINGTLNSNAAGANAPYIAGSGLFSIAAIGAMHVATGATEHSQSSAFTNAGSVSVTSGTLHFYAGVTNSGTLAASVAGTQMILSAGQTLTSTGAVVGTLKMLGATLALNGGAAQVGALALVLGSDSVLTSTANPSIPGGSALSVTSTAGGTELFVSSDFTNTGSVSVIASAANTANLVLTNGGQTFTNNGTVSLQGLNGNAASIYGAGSFATTATSKLTSTAGSAANGFGSSLTNNGTLESKAGALQITGSYTQTATGGLTIDVGGAAPVTGYGQVFSTGPATLNGKLTVVVTNGFKPVANEVFTQVLTFTSVTGDFAITNTVNPTAYFLHSFNATSMSLMAKVYPQTPGGTGSLIQGTALSSTLPGSDLNGDPITFSVVANPAHGTLSAVNAATGAFTYTPDPAYFGFDTFTYQAGDGVVTSAAGTLTITVLPKNLPQVLSIDVDQNPTQVGFVVNFTATATDPNGLPLTLSWDFGDATPIVTGSPAAHSFAAEATYTVTVTASDGLVSASATLPVQVFAPNSGADGVPNVSDGKPPIVNPQVGITLSVISSDGGVIELFVDASTLTRATVAISTEFDGIGTRTNPISGIRPVTKFVNPGLYVATAMALDPITTVIKGKARKTIAISRAETGQPALFKTAPKSNAVTGISIKGNFSFPKSSAASTGKADSVTLVGSFELAEGIDLSTAQEFDIGIGNIIDSIKVDAKGKAQLPGANKFIKKLQIRYPKLPKGSKITAAGSKAQFSVTIAGLNLSAGGFDTDGISNARLVTETALKTLPRSVQIDGLFAGAAFETLAPVQLKLSNTGDAGSIGTRK